MMGAGVIMTLEAANAQTQTWWGDKGKAVFVPQRSPFSGPSSDPKAGQYVVGLTRYAERLGGRIVAPLGTSRVDFETAFGVANELGYGPASTWPEDEAIADEA